MKILVLASLDAANYSICNITNELNRRGHDIRLYGFSLDQHNIRMFDNPCLALETLTETIISECDLIIAANDMLWRVIEAKKYIFCVNMASVLTTLLSEGGDIMFLPNYYYYRCGKERTLSIVAGNPKSISTASASGKKNSFLFIDSGHYPFSKEGKTELARLLIKICNKFTNYKLVIKPRFLKKDKDITHKNNLFLEDFIIVENNGKFPDNMDFLQEHVDMGKLIDEADVVLCMYTTAFLDVIEKGKKSIVIGNLPNNDSVDMNNQTSWDIFATLLNKSGCVVPYNNVIDYLPEGIECDKDFRQMATPQFIGGDPYLLICNAIEYVFKKYISQNKFIKLVDTDISRYEADLQQDESMSWDEIIRYRYYNEMMYVATRYLDSIGISITQTNVVDWINDKVSQLMESGTEFSVLHDQILDYLYECMYHMETELRNNPIKESYWLEAAYHFSPERITRLEDGSVLCKRSLHYYKGILAYENEAYSDAAKYLKKYFELTNNIDYEEYITDTKNFYQKAKQIYEYELPIFVKIEQGNKVIIYGLGYYGNLYINQIEKSGWCDLVAVIDRDEKKVAPINIKRITISDINTLEYDKLFIAIFDEEIRYNVKQTLINSFSVEAERIVEL